MNWIPQKVSKIELIYRGSRDGLNADAFHNYCDGKGETISIMKSNYGYIFGGFTNTKWNRNGNWVVDSLYQSFMFSLTHKKKFPLNENRN